MKVYLNYTNQRYSEQGRNGDWSASNNYIEHDISLNEKTISYESFNIDFEPKENIYVVKGVYTVGDSFGHESGKVEYLELFETKEEADLFMSKIELFNELNKRDWYGISPKDKKNKIRNLKWQLKDNIREKDHYGTPVYVFVYNNKEYFFPWGGMFEVLSYIDVIEIKVNKGE